MDQRGLRRARVAVAVTFAVHGAVTGSFATRIPWIQEHLHAGPGELGLALLAPAVGSLVAMPMAGRVIHRFGGRTATRWLIALWSAVLAFPALAPNLPSLFGILVVYGAVAGMCDVAMNAQGVVVEQRLSRSIMSGLHGMWSVGALAGGAVGSLAAQADVDARVHLAVMASALLAIGLGVSPLLLDVRAAEDQAAPPRFVLPSRSVLVMGLVGFCGVFGESASQDWCAVYLKQVTGTSPGVAAASFTAFAFTMAAGRLCGDMVVRRIGAVWAVRVSGALAALGGLLVATARTPLPAITGFMLIGVGIAVVVPLVFTAAGNAAPTPGEGVAGVATISYTSGFVAPSAIGGIANATSLPVSFAVVTALMAAMVLGAGSLARRPAPIEPESATAL
ncbi:MFS transporter [Planotetraspora sp. A-T 1434]|uniref:MFS transporter n=1 Tax=Planotetraspora sp. A-T 1434 TaxID=2979219 RepID=UPI0021C1C420|nr:MFS transporter [Planotetraspora sp. A-T 1434]MCT9933417.1 MFS transporter [Planotetraspora sp. A-T 1434]